jgi:predicted nucleic acid-binding protein
LERFRQAGRLETGQLQRLSPCSALSAAARACRASVLEDPGLADRALGWAAQGLDFADALHLARAQDCTAFMTFDRRLTKAAAGLSTVKVAAR